MAKLQKPALSQFPCIFLGHFFLPTCLFREFRLGKEKKSFVPFTSG